MNSDRRELRLRITEMNQSVRDLDLELARTGDVLADEQLKLSLLENSNKPGLQNLRVQYVRRLVNNRRKIDRLQRAIKEAKEELALAEKQLTDI